MKTSIHIEIKKNLICEPIQIADKHKSEKKNPTWQNVRALTYAPRNSNSHKSAKSNETIFNKIVRKYTQSKLNVNWKIRRIWQSS